MTFSETLNQWIRTLDCSGRDLASASGLSPSVISRYRKGDRQPAPNSESFGKLVAGLTHLSGQQGKSEWTPEIIRESFRLDPPTSSIKLDILVNKFNALIPLLDINTTDLAHAINFDPSYISKIRSQKRTPGNPAVFADAVAHFIVQTYKGKGLEEAMAGLVIGDDSLPADDAKLERVLVAWLLSPDPIADDINQDMLIFLEKLQAFDINEYIRAIHYDEIQMPPELPDFPQTRLYHGIPAMRQGELDFLMATATASSMEAVRMCCDMPMYDMAEDMGFNKKWVGGIALMLKRGLHLDVIHNMSRSFKEMILGIESWIPLYMTGQIAPFYFKSAQTQVYGHLNYVSGSVALTGECVNGHHDDGRYYLTREPEDLAYFKRKVDHMLEQAFPLMEIHRKSSQNLFRAFLGNDAKTPGRRRNFLPAPPLFTLSTDLLMDMLDGQPLSDKDRTAIFDIAAEQRRCVEMILEKNTVEDIVNHPAHVDFSVSPVYLSLADTFCELEIPYTPEQFRRHLEETRAFAASHPHYHFRVDERRAFYNLPIRCHENKWAIISKNRAPAIHLIVRQPNLRNALYNLVMPVVE